MTRRRLVLLGVVSGLLYVGTHIAQRAIHGGPDRAGFPAGLALYPIITIALFVAYVGVVALCGRPLSRTERVAAFGFPVLFSLFWLPAVPVFSSDVFAYIVHGYVSAELGENPYFTHSSAVAANPLGAELGTYGWRPVQPATPYGPVITHVETAIVSLTGADVRQSVLLFKLVAVVASLAVAVIVWLILGRVRPQDRDLGTVAYLWNPAVLVEAAGEGHNDAVMALLVLGTVLLVLRRQVMLAAFSITAAVLTKYVPLLMAPLLLRYLWRTGEARRMALGAAGAVALAVVLFAPYWRGPRTLAGIGASGRAGHTGATQTLVVEILSRAVGEATALRVVAVAAVVAIGLAALVAAARVRTPSDLVRWSAVLMIGYILLSPAYWPWYVILPVAILALTPRGSFLVLLVAMSLGSRLVAPLDSLYVDAVIGRPAFLALTWAGAVGLPVLALLVARRAEFGGVFSTNLRRVYRSDSPDRSALG